MNFAYPARMQAARLTGLVNKTRTPLRAERSPCLPDVLASSLEVHATYPESGAGNEAVFKQPLA